jgi:radical SAM protein with 4Fe4S-binding SPASM domain
MDCSEHWPSLEEYLDAFNRKADEQRVPTSGAISLTDRCNWDCVHCYAGPHRQADSAKLGAEMSTDLVLSCLDQVAEAGCLNLLLSGGEPLLRPDFPAIYERARTNGMLVTVFTNGTLIDDAILDLFEDFPPYVVEITVYGGSASTHDSITRTPGSFAQCLAGIEGLRKRGIRLKLKTILMTLNSHEFSAIEGLATSRGLDFRFDAEIFPTLEGDRAPLELRVSAKEAVAFEFADSKRAEAWTRYFSRGVKGGSSKALYRCGAGQRTFHIDSTGKLQPCLMVTNEDYSYDLKIGNFQLGWSEAVARIHDVRGRPGYACNQCEKQTLCGLCPGFNRLETASEDQLSEYACAIGHLRFRAIQDQLSKGGTR